MDSNWTYDDLVAAGYVESKEELERERREYIRKNYGSVNKKFGVEEMVDDTQSKKVNKKVD